MSCRDISRRGDVFLQAHLSLPGNDGGRLRKMYLVLKLYAQVMITVISDLIDDIMTNDL